MIEIGDNLTVAIVAICVAAVLIIFVWKGLEYCETGCE